MKKVTITQFISNVFWKLTDSILNKGVSLVVSIILARLLGPSDYGLMALIMVFIVFSDIFIQNSFNIALIRKPVVDLIEYSTVTYLSYAAALMLYLILFFVAPYLSIYYDKPELSMVMRVIALSLFFQAGAAVIRAQAVREMKFKQMSLVTFVSSLGSGIVGISMAINSMGIWALVAQQLVYNFLDMMMLILVFKWKFQFMFSLKIAKKLCRFSINVLGVAFLDFTANNISNLVIGKLYIPKYLGYLNRGVLLPEQVYMFAFNSVNVVMLPALVSRQNDILSLKNAVRKILVISAYLFFPMMGGLAIIGRNLIVLLLTDKWLPSVPILQWCCLTFACNIIRAINNNVLYAKEQGQIAFYIECFRCGLMILNIVVGLIVFRIDVYTFVMLNAIFSIVVVFISQIGVNKIIDYSCKMLICDIYWPIFLTLLMMYSLYHLGKLSDSSFIMPIQIFSGLSIYLVLSAVFKVEGFRELLCILRLFYKKI